MFNVSKINKSGKYNINCIRLFKQNINYYIMTNVIRMCGKTCAQAIYANIERDVKILAEKHVIPGLGVILVGNRKDSETYVNMKAKMCEKYGIMSSVIKLPESVDETTLLNEVKSLNNNTNIHGILIQLPLPKHIDEDTILNSVERRKDVDGFHIENVGRLSVNKNPDFYPCTPHGCLEMLKYYNYEIQGKHAVVVGRSRIVGLPLANLLLQHNATVSICHSRTMDLPSITRTADLLFVACGQAKHIKGNMVKKDAIVVDIGINSIDDPTKKSGYRLVGDVDYDDVVDNVKAITPVPGGVGPMTIAMLLNHTITAAQRYAA